MKNSIAWIAACQLAVMAIILLMGVASASTETRPAAVVRLQANDASAQPPPQRVEIVPPPPSEDDRVMYWTPGHWARADGSWTWKQGHYAALPADDAGWAPID